MGYEKPIPKPNSDTRVFWNGCRDHELRFQKCKECGHVRWPPSIICPKCYSSETELVLSRGKGRVYSFVVYHVAFHPAFRDEVPYVTAIVELQEGPHLLTNIVGCKASEITCDMPVEVVWEDITEELSLPKFKPA